MSNEKLSASTTYAAIVGRIIVLRREAKGMDQAALAKSQNLSQSSWSRLERGESVINTEQLHSVAQELGTTAGDILNEADDVAAELRTRNVEVQTSKSVKGGGAMALIGIAALTALIVAVASKDKA